MLPQAVIDPQVSREPGVSLLGVLDQHGISPFLAEGLDEPLGLAVGTWRVRPGAIVLELKDAAGFGKGLGDVGRSVVAHHLTTLHTRTIKPGRSPTQEASHFDKPLIQQHHEMMKLIIVINCQVEQVKFDASRAVVLPIACDEVHNLPKGREPL